jgi:AcrR family transcriptional regulator
MATAPTRKRLGTRREAILDAAEALVIEQGAAHLTMDAVAARAKVSKGGVLHHFPTKTDLIKAMLDRLLTVFRADMDMIERIAGANIKDHLRAWINLMQTIDKALDSLSAALLSASANDPSLLAPFAAQMQERVARYRNSHSNFGHILVILTALDGYWLFTAVGLDPLRGADATAFFNALHTIVDGLEEPA